MRDRQPLTTIVFSTDRRTTKRLLAELADIAARRDTVTVVPVGDGEGRRVAHLSMTPGHTWAKAPGTPVLHEMVVLLDDRASLTGDWLTEVSRFLAHPSVDAVAPRTNLAAGDELFVGIPYRANESGARHAFARQRLRTHTGRATSASVLDGPCVAVRREWLEKTGVLDEIGAGCPDLAELTSRIADAGGRLVVAEAAYAHHRGGAPLRPVPDAGDPGRPRAAGPLVSACLIVRDEADNLPRALASLTAVADEIVVYDTGSTDDTCQLARAAGAHVVDGYWDDDFARARNDALAHCAGQWILWLDADEALVCADARQLRHDLAASSTGVEGYVVLIDNLRGNEAATALTHPACRLFRRATGHWQGRVHEQVVARAGRPDLGLEIADGVRITHWGYLQHALSERDKGERNVRTAFADLVGGDDVEPAVRLVSLGRSRMLAGQYPEGIELCRTAAATASRPGTVRLALRAVIEGELALNQAERALDDVALLKTCTAVPALALALEGRAHLALGDHQAALAAFDQMPEGLDDDGFEYGPTFVAAERAGALMGLGRFAEAADALLDSLEHQGGLDAHIGALVESLEESGRPLAQILEAMPSDRLEAFLPQVLQLQSDVGDRLLDAFWEAGATTRAVLATAAPLAARLGVARQLVWSTRLRAHGLASACPLVAGVTDLGRDGRDRVLGAAVAAGALGDRRGRLGFGAAVADLDPDQRAQVRAEVAAIDPGLLATFDALAPVTAERTADPAATAPTGQRVLVIDDAVAGLRTLSVAAMLARKGHEVTVLHPQPAAPTEGLMAPHGVAVHGWRGRPGGGDDGWTVPATRFLARRYAERTYDVVVLAGTARALAADVRRLLPLASVVVDLDDADADPGPVDRVVSALDSAGRPAVACSAPGLLRAPPATPLHARLGVCVVGDFRHVDDETLEDFSAGLAPALAAVGDAPIAVIGDDPGSAVSGAIPGALAVGPLADPTAWLRAARVVVIPFRPGAGHWLMAAVMCGTTALVVPDDPAAAMQVPAAVAGLLSDDDLWRRFSATAWPDRPDPEGDPLEGLGPRPRSRTPVASGARPVVRLTGGVFSRQSLHHVNRELVRRLSACEDLAIEVVTPEIGPRPVDTAADLAGVRILRPGSALGRCDVEVRHQWPPDFTTSDAGRLVLIQPWEFGGLPAEWVGPLRDVVDELWVPTTWVRDGAVDSGVPVDKVHVVANGVDVDVFTPSGLPYRLRTDKTTKFLFVGGCIERKGIDALLEAYLSTFSRRDDVVLVVKPFGSDGVYRTSSLESSVRQAAAGGGAEIELVDGDLSAVEMAALYRTCDALVHPYRGEGFGLPIAEAMASGLPVIVPDGGACLDFCDAQNAWLVPARRVDITPSEWTPSVAGSWWLEPSRRGLSAAMRQVVGDPVLAARRGDAGRRRIVAGFTWEHAAAAAEARLRNLLGLGPSVPAPGGRVRAPDLAPVSA